MYSREDHSGGRVGLATLRDGSRGRRALVSRDVRVGLDDVERVGEIMSRSLTRDTIVEHEDIARRVAGETLADLRTVRREMREPGSVRGFVGLHIRECLAKHQVTSTDTSSNPLLPCGKEGRSKFDVIGAVAVESSVDREVVLRVLDAYNRLRHIPWRIRLERDGQKWGRPSSVDEATRVRAVELHAAGQTVREIARALKVPRSTIGRAIKARRP